MFLIMLLIHFLLNSHQRRGEWLDVKLVDYFFCPENLFNTKHQAQKILKNYNSFVLHNITLK